MKQAMIDEDLLDSDDLRETDESESESDASPDEPGTTLSACSEVVTIRKLFDTQKRTHFKPCVN